MWVTETHRIYKWKTNKQKKTPNSSNLQFLNLEACVCPIILCLLVSKYHHFIRYTVYFGHVDTILYNKRMSLLILYMLIIHIMVQNISELVSIRAIFYPDIFFSFSGWVFFLLILDLLDISLPLCLTFHSLFRLNLCEKAGKPVSP